MTTVTVALHAQFRVSGRGPDGPTTLSPAELRDECDKVMEALVELEGSGCGIADSAVAADASERTVEISLTATGPTYEDAEACGSACMRTAIHTGGGHTPNWNWDLTAEAERSELIPA